MFAPQGYGSGGGGSTGITSLSELLIDVSKNWNGKRIQNLGEPLNISDAATKLYVDDKFTGSDNEILRYDAASDSMVSSNGITISDDSRIIIPCVSAGNLIPLNLKASTEGIDSGLAACRRTPGFSCGYLGHSLIGLVNNMIGTISVDQYGSALFLNTFHTNAIEFYIRDAGKIDVWKRPLVIENGAIDNAFIIGNGVVVNGLLTINGSATITGTYNINGIPHNHDELYINKTTPIIYGNFNANGFKITSLSDPEIGSDVVTKSYVDAYIMGLIWRDAIVQFASEIFSPATDNYRVIIDTDATGDWESYIDYIATYDLESTSWTYEQPASMWTVFCKSEEQSYTYTLTDGWAEIGWAGNHSGLSNLTADDHLQYVHTSVARSISAIHTFDASTPFNVSNTGLVNNLNAELLNGHTYSELSRVVTTSYNGLCPQLPGDGSYFLSGNGSWTEIDVSGLGTGTWGQITGIITDQADLVLLLAEKLGVLERAYDSERLGGISYYDYATIGDITNAGEGLSETTDNRFNVNVDNRTIFINSYDELEVIGGDGDLNVYAESPVIIASTSVGGVEAGYELSGKHIKTVIKDILLGEDVSTTSTPYVFGYVTETSPVDFSTLTNTINETYSTKVVEYATSDINEGYLSFGYPSSYGELTTIEFGMTLISQNIIGEFDVIISTLYDTAYTIYRHKNISDLSGIDSFKVRFSKEVSA